MVICVSGLRPAKMKRRSSICFEILALPEDIIVSILSHACEHNLQDVRHIKITCKRIKQLAETPIFYRPVNLIRMNVPWIDKSHVEAFLNSCCDSGNITAVFFRGMATYAEGSQRLDGIIGVKAAADAGVNVAKYAYGMIMTTFPQANDKYHLDSFSFVRGEASELARESATLLNMGCLHENRLWVTKARTKRQIDHLTRCGCRRYNPWLGGIVPIVQEDGMCDQCFWEYHTKAVFPSISKVLLKWQLEWL